MIKKTCGVLAASLLLGLASCSDDNPWMGIEGGQGAIKLCLDPDGRYEDAIPKTKADPSEFFNTPIPEDFYVHLIKSTGEIHTQLPYEDFIKVTSFPGGSYVLKAFTGDLKEEGFGINPYFEGNVQVVVLEGQETEAVVRPTMGHTMVSVSYTDAFKNYMQSFSSTVHSEGHKYIDVPQDEMRPAFLVPGKVSLTLNFTDPQGRELTLTPAQFDAEAATHYQIRLNVNNGEVGQAQLEIQFLGVEETETVTIDLSDELFSAPEPEVNTVNFNDNEEVVLECGLMPEESYKFSILSYGGLNNVSLTFNTLEGNYRPAFGSEVNLIGASEAVQAQLAAAGIDCKGVFRNPEKMALIDVAGIAKALPVGRYQISVLATDMLGRSSAPATIEVVLKDPSIEITPEEANGSTLEGTLIVKYNGANLMQDLTFMAANKRGMMVAAPIIKSEEITTRAMVERIYRVTIKLPELGEYALNNGIEEIQAYLKGSKIENIDLPIAISFAVDAFAKHAVVLVSGNPDKVKSVVNNVQISLNGSLVTEDIDRNADKCVITLSGLNEDQHYSVTFSDYGSAGVTSEFEFTTEKAAQLPNNDFSKTSVTIDSGVINAGGKYGTSGNAARYQNKSSILRSTADGWGDNNNTTCDLTSSAEKNTWFFVPSTFVEDGTVTVRSVGYNKEGGTIANYGSGLISAPYYSQNAPNDLTPTAGQLYVGSDPKAGISFTSRPQSMTFTYSYTRDTNEKEGAYAEISLYAGSQLIGTSTQQIAENGSGTLTLTIPDYKFGEKATSVRVMFKSSTATSPAITIPTGAALNDSNNKRDVTIAANQYKSFAKGSELKISNVILNY